MTASAANPSAYAIGLPGCDGEGCAGASTECAVGECQGTGLAVKFHGRVVVGERVSTAVRVAQRHRWLLSLGRVEREEEPRLHAGK